MLSKTDSIARVQHPTVRFENIPTHPGQACRASRPKLGDRGGPWWPVVHRRREGPQTPPCLIFHHRTHFPTDFTSQRKGRCVLLKACQAARFVGKFQGLFRGPILASLEVFGSAQRKDLVVRLLFGSCPARLPGPRGRQTLDDAGRAAHRARESPIRSAPSTAGGYFVFWDVCRRST